MRWKRVYDSKDKAVEVQRKIENFNEPTGLINQSQNRQQKLS